MSVPAQESVLTALRQFARDVKENASRARLSAAQAEDQLKHTVPRLVETIGQVLGRRVTYSTEATVENVGRPDIAIHVDDLLVGYIELKAPGQGTTTRDFSGSEGNRNRQQLRKFKRLPNLIYTDANDWTFYQKVDGRKTSARRQEFDVRLRDLTETGDEDINMEDAERLLAMFREFLQWEPIVPTNARALAEQLAPLTRVLRDDVEEAVKAQRPALSSIYQDWRRTLFPQATPKQFADSYAQTLAYGLLLAKLSGATTLATHEAAAKIAHHSSLLARTLEILTQPGTRDELGPGLDLLERTIEAVDPATIRSNAEEDPWLYFYEDFLAVYDPKLRDERGVYYTPAQVVKAQVTLVDELLRTRLNRPLGFADPDVTVLDPATGTGTYLLRILQHGVDHAAKLYGPGSAGAIASQMADNLYGFELLVGPYAVAHLRMNQAIQEAGGREPVDGVHIYLTDTLESPNETKSLPHSFYEKPLAEEHRRAREVKRQTPILVCIGNPPYEREESETADGRTAGSWIRFGDPGSSKPPLLDTFVKPAQAAGAGLHIKNLYNLYVYFWRWALWKVLETQDGPGIVSFITASSYVRGPGFVGMREEMRRAFDELWILDLEGDSRGTRRTENVFDIRTPVAIAVGVRYGKSKRDQPAQVHYTRVTGTRVEKFSVLAELNGFEDLSWESGQTGWGQPLLPDAAGDYFAWPSIINIMPWQHSGVQLKRSWPIGESPELLKQRWTTLLRASDRATYFRETRDRRVSRTYPDQLHHFSELPAIDSLTPDAEPPEIVRYGYRSFDRQYVLKDTRVGDFYRPPVWHSMSDKQIFLISTLSLPRAEDQSL